MAWVCALGQKNPCRGKHEKTVEKEGFGLDQRVRIHPGAHELFAVGLALLGEREMGRPQQYHRSLQFGLAARRFQKGEKARRNPISLINRAVVGVK